MLWDDFKKIKHYTVYINNVIWSFSFQEHRIIINNKDNIDIDDSPILIYETSIYQTYYKAFLKIIEDINNLYYCNICKKFETDFCKTCMLNSEVDKLSTDIYEDCPICYDKLTVRYITICNDIRHKICQKCNKIDLKKCPICRNNKSTEQINYNYPNQEQEQEQDEDPDIDEEQPLY